MGRRRGGQYAPTPILPNASHGLHEARGNSASASPWSESTNDGKMVGKTDSIIKHSARCAWRISQGIIANCICVNCHFCHFVGLQKPTKTTIPTKLTSVMCSLVVQRLSSPHVQISRIFREQYSSNPLSILCDYYVITMILLCYSKHFIIPPSRI